MLFRIFRFIGGFFFITVSDLDRTELETGINRTNMAKVKSIAITFIVLEVIRITDLFYTKRGELLTQRDGYYLTMYLSLIIMMILFLGIFIYLGKNIPGHRTGIQAAGISFTSFLLFWCAGISLLDQTSYGQIIIYLTAIISIAVVPLFKPIVFLLIYLTAQGFFIGLLPFVQHSDEILRGNYINSTLFLILSFVISRIRYKTWIEDYRNKKIIQEKSDEIYKINEDLRQANQKLIRLSQVDSLTGIYNRSTFDRTIKKEWDRCRRHATPLSLFMIDIDFFKAYNDNYGHQAGDDCIRRVAETLSGCMKRASDVVARYGGDEFSVILPHMEREKALQLAENLKIKLAELAIPHNYSSVSAYVTVSIGVHTVVPSNGLSIEELLKASDKALYEAKKDRDAVCGLF